MSHPALSGLSGTLVALTVTIAASWPTGATALEAADQTAGGSSDPAAAPPDDGVPSESVSTESAGRIDAATEAIVRDLLRPEVSASRFGTAAELRRRAGDLRALWERLEARGVEELPVELRRELFSRLEQRLATLLAGAVTGVDVMAARVAVANAKQDCRDRRRLALYATIKNWCPAEKWTVTLADCFKDCANQQKRLIAEWLEEGLSDQEVRDRMVEQAGTDKVLVKPGGRLSFLAPIAVFLLGAVAVGLCVWRLRRRAPPPAGRVDGGGDGGGSRTEAAPEGSTGAGPATGAGARDPWEDRLDRQLEELD